MTAPKQLIEIYTELTDTYGNDVRVQQSSSVEPRVWIFSSQGGADCVLHLGEWQAHSPHLSPAQARQVAEALLRFADDSD